MSDIIHLLPDAIANQIAAGEVVQRPASVVKELMENAIDAGSTKITLIVKEAGRTLVQVIDNGSGMSETDARMSLERHATSKIRTADDLFTLRTMGFRGEALASIAAVSQFEMRTRQTHAELGTLLLVEGSEVKSQEPVACDTGTSISVKNLFFNIPARRNFLKSNPVEMRHILDEFQRIALAYPGRSFTLIQGDEVVYDLQPGKLVQRIIQLFGKSYQGQVVTCQEATDLVSVTGYIGAPAAAKKTRGEQFIFVNDRFVRNNYLNHAVLSAYENLLPAGSFPFYLLLLSIDPKHIDVNVHPTKTEIKFDDERAVYAVVKAAVRQALGAHNLAPAIDYSADVNILGKFSSLNQEEFLAEQLGSSFRKTDPGQWEKLFETTPLPSGGLFDAAPLRHEEAPVPVDTSGIVFQLDRRFVVQTGGVRLMIIDQQAAHERILYEKYLKQLQDRSAASVQSLFPQTVTLSPADFALVQELEPEIKALGFQFEIFGKQALLINGLPADAAGMGESGLLEGLLEQFKDNQSKLSLPLPDNLARSLARRASIKSGRALQQEEMNSLVSGLMSCKNPAFAPDGRTTFFTFDSSMIEKYLR